MICIKSVIKCGDWHGLKNEKGSQGRSGEESDNECEGCKDLTFYAAAPHKHRKRARSRTREPPLPSVRHRPIVYSFHSQSVASANSQLSTWCHCNYPSTVKTMIKYVLLTCQMLSHYIMHSLTFLWYTIYHLLSH